MDGENPRERAQLTEDFLHVLVDRGYVRPDDAVPVEDAVAWFAKRDRDLAADIIADLTSGDGPVAYETAQRERIWATSEGDVEERIESLREDPPWFDW